MDPVSALVDCENFYVSCERVFDPALRDVPVAVLSNNDGCIIARSEELKQAGVPMGAPLFKWKEELGELGTEVLSSNYALYVSRARVSSENVLYKQKEHGSLRRLDGPTGLSCVA